MRKAIGFLIVLWGLSKFFSASIPAMDDAARETFKTVEIAAKVAQGELQEKI